MEHLRKTPYWTTQVRFHHLEGNSRTELPVVSTRQDAKDGVRGLPANLTKILRSE